MAYFISSNKQLCLLASHIFIGSLCTGVSEVFGIAVGAAVIAGGVFTLAVALFLRNQKKKQSLASQDQMTNVT